MCFLLSSFSCFRFGSVSFVLHGLFLVLMRSLIGAGSIEFCVFACPLGMWCLSAVRIRLVRSLFEGCTLSGAGVFERACSISSLKPVQFAFLQLVKVLGVCWSRKFSVMVIVMRMGRWSEWSTVSVSHCVLLSRLDDIVVMSGELGC